jgi:hypothetical protein
MKSHVSIDGAKQDLWAKEPDTRRLDMKTQNFNNACGARRVKHWPLYYSFTADLIFTRQVTNFHFAGAIGAWFEIPLMRSKADRCASIHNEWTFLSKLDIKDECEESKPLEGV